ncbi:MAG: enolase C-terminal domain-like protein [Pirellulaceae bacterium]
MQIAAIETYPVRIALRPKYRMISALGAHDKSEYVLVRVLTDDGAEGVGEATVTARWSGETAWSVEAIIQRVLSPALIGMDPHDVAAIDAKMDALAACNWFAKSAVEMACWDLQGKAAEKPVYQLLGGPHRPLSIRGRFSLGAYDIERARSRAAELVEEGFDTVKVKVGGKLEDDVARVKAVREVIGGERALVIDANGGWDADTALAALAKLTDARIALFEQPTPVGDYAALARVRREGGVPIMADDTCFDLVHARELIRNECCDVISVYPGKNGGIRKSKQIAEFAAEHGVACTIGSNLELDVGAAAMGHLIVGCQNLQVEKYPGDNYGPVYHETRIAKNPLAIKGAVTTITDGAGLGIDVDWNVVRASRFE